MGLRVAAALCGLVGGLTWISALIFDRASGGTIVDVLTWTGMFLLGVATVSAGASLVSSSAFWLRILVAVCFVLLAGSVLSVLVDAVGAPAYAAVGTAGVVVAAVVLARRRPVPAAGGHRAGGAHAR